MVWWRCSWVRDQALNLCNPSPHIRGGQGIFQGGLRGRAKAFFKLEVECQAQFDCFSKGGYALFQAPRKGGETKSKPEKISPEQGFTRSIARSLTLEDARGIHAIKYRYKRRRKILHWMSSVTLNKIEDIVLYRYMLNLYLQTNFQKFHRYYIPSNQLFNLLVE